MRKIVILILLMAACALLMAAHQNEDENKTGSAYGSAVVRDTDYVEWNGDYYIDVGSRDQLSILFKVLTAAADTLIYNFLGSNFYPDSLRFYYTIQAETLYQHATGADTLYGDSTVVFNLPYGTAALTSVLPEYVKVQIILADTTGGNEATATIGDGFTVR